MGTTNIGLTPTSAPATSLARIPHTDRTTAYDLVERLLAMMGASEVKFTLADCQWAVAAAVREFGACHEWSYLWKPGRINLVGAVGDGTIAFDLTGGTFERMVTLTDSTWPTWAAYGFLRVGGVVYQVETRVSDTVLTLTAESAPAEDIAAGTTYQIGRDTYTLPEDWLGAQKTMVESVWAGMYYLTPHEWLRHVRYLETSAMPRCYTFTADPKIPNRMAIRLYPTPDAAQTLDFMYHTAIGVVNTFEYSAGKVTVAAADNTLTLAGGTFRAKHVGSVIRLAADAKNLPTGKNGVHPFEVERNITAVLSGSQVTLDDAIDDAYTSVAYRLSDPLNIDDGVMLSALESWARKSLGVHRSLKQLNQINQDWQLALELAMEADNRDRARKGVSLHGPYRMRLADMPRGADES